MGALNNSAQIKLPFNELISGNIHFASAYFIITQERLPYISVIANLYSIK